eukprot:gene7485-11228_t
MHHHNYYWKKGTGQKINTLKYEQLEDGVLFLNSNHAFTLKFLEFSEALCYRVAASGAGVMWCVERVLYEGIGDMEERARHGQIFWDAMFYRFVLLMRQKMGITIKFEFDRRKELTTEFVNAFSRWLHRDAFLPKDPTDVICLVMDGHKKTRMRIGGSCQTAGDDEDDSEESSTEEIPPQGWFMIMI